MPAVVPQWNMAALSMVIVMHEALSNRSLQPQDVAGHNARSKSQWASPRVMVLGWCMWLLGTWGAALLADSAVPATRWMLFSSFIGLMALWPTVRLSLDRGDFRYTNTEVLMEWLALTTIFQAVVWPLGITAQWSFLQTLWLDGAVVAWSLLTALFVATGVRSRRTFHRLLATALCLLVLVGEPLIMTLVSIGVRPGQSHGWVMRISPIQTIWALSEMPIEWSSGPWRTNVATVAVAAAVGWGVSGLFAGHKGRY